MGIMTTPGLPRLWRLAAPEQAGLSPEIGNRLDAGFARGDYAGLHALLILRHGQPAFEHYFAGQDACWGKDLGIVDHGPERLHDVRSISKSIVGLLYGIALARKIVPPTTARLMDSYPAHADLAGEPLRRRITIGHVLSMRMGIEWQEDLQYDNPANSENEMDAAPDRYRYILSRPMVEKPGSRWVYCGGATALLGDLIERGSGLPLAEFAHAHLFAPLGIEHNEWVRGSDGRAVASSGLRLLPRDLAIIGQMLLDKGFSAGRRVVPAGWLATSFKPRAFVESGLRYGYQWWLGNLAATGKPWQAAYGNGGQRLIVIPSLGMAVVILAGNYNAADQWKMPLRLMNRIVIPSVLPA